MIPLLASADFEAFCLPSGGQRGWGPHRMGITWMFPSAGWSRVTRAPSAETGPPRAGRAGCEGPGEAAVGQTGTVLSLAAPGRPRWDLAAWPGYKSRVSAVARVSLTPLCVWGPRITASLCGGCPNTSSACQDVLWAGMGCEPWKWDFIQASPQGEECSPASRTLLEWSMFLGRRRINLGTSFLLPTLFPGCFFFIKTRCCWQNSRSLPRFSIKLLCKRTSGSS